jgi:hypothetical protein
MGGMIVFFFYFLRTVGCLIVVRFDTDILKNFLFANGNKSAQPSYA